MKGRKKEERKEGRKAVSCEGVSVPAVLCSLTKGCLKEEALAISTEKVPHSTGNVQR